MNYRVERPPLELAAGVADRYDRVTPTTAESLFHDWRSKGARLADLLAFARVRPLASAARQGKLLLD